MTGTLTNKAGVSIIVPIFNEAKNLPPFIKQLFGALESRYYEIIFVDGGSQDKSCSIVLSFEHCILIRSEKGRAKQLNAGAKKSQYPLLYFIHVDCIPPPGFDQIILSHYKNGEKAGSFQLQFDFDHFALNWAALATKYNSRFCRSGDQSLFIEKELFEQLNGFNEDYAICEDIELTDRLYRLNHFTVLPEKIITSARRFKANGVLRLQFHHGCIHLMRYLGIKPYWLYQYYSRFVK